MTCIMIKSSLNKVSFYSRSWSTLSLHFRTFCNTKNKDGIPSYHPSKQPVVIEKYGEFCVGKFMGNSWPDFPQQFFTSEAAADWPDVQMGVLSQPNNHKFPLPGFIGTNIFIPTDCNKNPEPLTDEELCDLFPIPTDKQSSVLADLNDQMGSMEVNNELRLLECVAFTIPKRVHKEVQGLFPDKNIKECVTVITMSQKTINDMSKWDENVELERNELLYSFVEGAKGICNSLIQSGYWADFIDPSSGKPYLNKVHTNNTLFETDESYREFGFTIDDLGCCKVLRHNIWGTHAYVGTIFTDAPLSHPAISQFGNK